MASKKSFYQRVLFVLTHPDVYWQLFKYNVRIVLESMQGLDFVKIEQAPSLQFSDNRLNGYWSSANKYLDSVLEEIEVEEDDKILDIGCGKGAALVKFHRKGFKQVDGIEYTEKLSVIATKNLKRLRLDCQIFQSDARYFNGYDHYNYFYFYNPFTGDIMNDVIRSLEISIKNRPRKIVIIYKNAVCDDIVLKHGVFQKIKEFPNQPNEKPFVIYANQVP
ncbi:MAG: hypothetical protein RIR96_1311 [Bacteroidota bacterium]|jgi:SAM-dependent methyltransferase